MSFTKMSKHISKIRHLFYASYISVSSKYIYIYIYIWNDSSYDLAEILLVQNRQ